MKKFFTILIALIICAATSTTFAEESTCILLKFSNDTRYKNVDSASVLSDLVVEKLLASGKFNFKETNPIDEDIEAKLYDVKTRELLNLTTGLQNKNLNPLFEGQGFDRTQAQSIGTADVGQIITPSITAAIGRDHGAQYLIQGTIINLGQGNFSGKFDTTSPGQRGGVYFYQKEAGIGVTVALRIIKAETGEVVWAKDVSAQKKTALTQLGMFMIGTAKISTDMYSKMMEDAATKISNAMLEDLNAHRLFTK